MPSRFTPDDLARVARLARVALTPEEQQLFAEQLTRILAYADQVQEVDTSGIPPTSHPTGATTPFRDDEVRPPLPRDVTLAQAPDADGTAGLFKVPRVLG